MAIPDFSTLLETKSPASVASTLLIAGVVLFVVSYYQRNRANEDDIPYLGIRPGPWFDIKTRSRWITSSEKLLMEGWSQYGGSPFRVLTTIGELIMLRPNMATEVANSALFSSYNEKLKSFAAQFPGAEPMAFSQGEMQVLIGSLMHSITQSLGKPSWGRTQEISPLSPLSLPLAKRVPLKWLLKLLMAELTDAAYPHTGASTPILASETAEALDDLLVPSDTSPDNFTPIRFKDVASHLTARLSARIFLGERASRDKEWLRLSLDYISTCAAAVIKLCMLHPYLYRVASVIMPEFWRLPQLLRSLRKRLGPEIEARKQRLNESRSARPLPGEKEPREEIGAKQQQQESVDAPLDVLQWMVDKAHVGTPFDPVLGQIYLSFVSTHTTSMTMVAAMYEVLSCPEYIEPLRKEVSEVLAEEKGWTKRALQKMVLMDSVLKESQRLHMLGAVSGLRYAKEPVTLSDGTEVPKGDVVAFPTWPMKDSMFYTDPKKFDGYRFLRMRNEPGKGGAAYHYVSTSVAHVGFGYGKDSCPGRFVAASVLKIALAFLITRYDWKVTGGGLTRSIANGSWVPNPKHVIAFRPRVAVELS